MKRLLLAAALLCFAAGCAHFKTTQVDERTDPETGVKDTITTTASATTFLASKSTLASWKASQTETEQGAQVGGVSQGADASKLVEAVVRAAVSSATSPNP